MRRPGPAPFSALAMTILGRGGATSGWAIALATGRSARGRGDASPAAPPRPTTASAPTPLRSTCKGPPRAPPCAQRGAARAAEQATRLPAPGACAGAARTAHPPSKRLCAVTAVVPSSFDLLTGTTGPSRAARQSVIALLPPMTPTPAAGFAPPPTWQHTKGPRRQAHTPAASAAANWGLAASAWWARLGMG